MYIHTILLYTIIILLYTIIIYYIYILYILLRRPLGGIYGLEEVRITACVSSNIYNMYISQGFFKELRPNARKCLCKMATNFKTVRGYTVASRQEHNPI